MKLTSLINYPRYTKDKIKRIKEIIANGANHSSSSPLTENKETIPSINSKVNIPNKTIIIAIKNPTLYPPE